MKRLLLLPVLFLIFTGCGGNVKADKEVEEMNNYKFSYTPYDNIDIKDRNLYNTVFNIVRNKLVFYVTNTFPTYKKGQPLGLAIELSDNGMTGDFETIIKSKYLRGWSVTSTNMTPVAKEDIDAANSGNASDAVKSLPKVLYIIQVEDDSAKVYVRYWMVQYRNYNSIYTLKKGGRWSVTKSENLD